jgi:hypothetical protein
MDVGGVDAADNPAASGAIIDSAGATRQRHGPSRSTRPALSGRQLHVAGRSVPWVLVVTHLILLVAAIGYWGYLDRHLWFYGDEWDFINRRGLFHPQLSIWTPHNEHWSTLPILLWRAIYNVFHLSSYWPYLIPLFIAHILIVHLVWRRMLREGVPAWLATSMAGLLGLLGSGWEDLGWAFQIGFLGSVLFGLWAMDVADGREVTTLRRDIATSVIIMAAFMCSTGGDCMWLGLALVLIMTRPWRQTVRILAPPIVCYLIWFELVGKNAVGGDHIGRHTYLEAPAFIWAQVIEALGSRRVLLGAVVAILLGIWAVRHARRLTTKHPAVVGMVIGAISFYGLAALGRDRFGLVTPDRYTYIGVALLMPLIGLAVADQTNRRWRWSMVRPVAIVAVLGVLVAYTYGNVVLGKHAMAGRVAYVQKQHRLIVNAAQLIADGGPYIASYRFPESSLDPSDVLHLWRLHQLPHVGAMDMTDQLYFDTRLDVALTDRAVGDGRFELVGHLGNTATSSASGCETFAPLNPASQSKVPPAIRLRMVGNAKTATALLRTPGDLSVYVALRPNGRLTSVVAAHVAATGQVLDTGTLVTGRIQTNPLATATVSPLIYGVSHIYDVRPGADLVVTLPSATTVELCGLAPTQPTARSHRGARHRTR